MSEHAIAVLKEEATHLREALGRVIGTIYTLFGVVMPIVIGAAFLVGEKAADVVRLDLLGFGVLAIVSAAIAYSNTLWLEAHEYLRYKYLVLWPRMYKLVELAAEENFMQYQARTRLLRSWLPALIFQVAIMLAALILGVTFLWPLGAPWGLKTWLLVAGLILFTGAVVSSLVMASSIKTLRLELVASNPVVTKESRAHAGHR